MSDQACPTCGNPIGLSLKEWLARRDRVMPFVTKHEALRTKFQKWESDLTTREAKLRVSEYNLLKLAEKLANDEAALVDLMTIARRPEQEFLQLREENQELRHNLTIEEQNWKAADDELDLVSGELAELKKTSSELIQNLKEAKRDLGALKGNHARVNERLVNANAEISLLKRAKSELATAKQILEGSTKSLQERVRRLEEENNNPPIGDPDEEIADIPSFAITDLDLLCALSCEVTDRFSPPSEIVTLGSGPFPEIDFDNYLRSLGVKACADDCPWIIVGRKDWSEEELNELIDKSNLQNLRVFSQELFIAGFLTTHDPFSLPLEILMKFAEGHPALEHLIREGFNWPAVKKRRKTPESWGELEKESPLTLMGYHVGETKNLSIQVRRSKLRNVFLGELKNVDNAKRAKWGRPNTSKRLQMIATHIDNDITKNRTKRNWKRAIREWKDDLEWLKMEFYTNRMRFKWPGG